MRIGWCSENCKFSLIFADFPDFFVNFKRLNTFDMHYEECGLFLGLISYPFSIDGKCLYNRILKNIFITHKANMLKCTNRSESKADPIDDLLYSPVAYRMFGTHGLAILSLVDDYAFCSRIFNPNHVRLSDEDEADPSLDGMKNKFQSVVITNVSEKDSIEPGFREKAKNTFLRETRKYPFIGIIRLKIDYRLLEGQGIDTIHAVRRFFKEKYVPFETVELDYLLLDCFDNDELVVIAFSNKVCALYEFLGRIRKLNCKDVGIDYGKIIKNEKKIAEKHIFASCHQSFGYHIGYDVEDTSRNQEFLEVEYVRDGDTGENVPDCDSNLKINCICETKPGHMSYFCKYLNETFDLTCFQRTVTGGTVVCVEFPLAAIHKIETLCQKESEGFLMHLRRIKITLKDPRLPGYDTLPEGKEEKFEAASIIPEKYILRIEKLVKLIGISKIVREKMLSLFRLYNDCCNNHLQYLYFEELNPALESIEPILDNLKDQADIREIEEILNEEIAALEEAFYNRMHNSKSPNTTLEYSGGVQQLLTSFNYAYRQVVRLLSPRDSYSVYSRITGAERVSSMRTHLDLNINHIIYPELFATTAWKEAANFSSSIQNTLRRTCNERFKPLINTWNDFVGNPDSYKALQYELMQRTEFQRDDSAMKIIRDILKDGQPLKYFINDYIVYHMAFQRNYRLMWHFYLKTMLQTTNCYHSLGKIRRRHFVYIMLRLFMIALRETGERRKEIFKFLEQRIDTPYDYLLAEVWCDSFSKIREASEVIFNILEDYGFSELSELLTFVSENLIVRAKIVDDNSGNIKPHYMQSSLDRHDVKMKVEACLEERKALIKDMYDSFTKYELVEPGKAQTHSNPSLFRPDFIVCMLHAYLCKIYEFDGMSAGNEPILKSVPRNSDGEIDYAVFEDSDRAPGAIHIMADPVSGFLATSQTVRNQYFALRTTLYRSLWNYRMKGPKILRPC